MSYLAFIISYICGYIGDTIAGIWERILDIFDNKEL